MRRQLIATTALIALAAILVLGVPLGLVDKPARSDALGRLEREADEIAAAASRGLDADALALAAARSRSHGRGRHPAAASRQKPGGTLLATRSGATQGVRVTVYASAAEVNAPPAPRCWPLVGSLAVIGTAAAAGLAVLQARRFVRPLERLADTWPVSGPATSRRAPGTWSCPSSTAWRGARHRGRPDRSARRPPA